MIKFTESPLCPKCGNNWINWNYIDPSMTTLSDIKMDHFELECNRCEYVFLMHTKDYMEEDNG